MPEKKQFERLPSSVVPINYNIRLRTYLDRFTFEGEEKIQIQVNEAVDRVVMNVNDMKVSAAKFLSSSGSFPASDILISDEHETLTLVFDRPLPVGEAHLHLSFVGNLNDKMKGFYRSKYVTPSGEERFGAVTQFEATDARRAFPCWDEPAVKATYDVTLVCPKDRVALSNMPVKSEVPLSDDADWKVVEYERTPIMSTYLVAFVVGEYDYVEERDEDGVLIRVYTPLGKKEQGLFALKVSVKTLPFYKRYFNIAYPLVKMDLIAIADFAMGAMENWGLVTYRETALLVDPTNSSATSKQYVAMVVGHELAHQWFGNLVTMEWWTHLWLNEGFASWIEYLCVDECFPEYDIWTQFMVMDYARALELDALQSSHPIEVPVGHPAEVEEIFDAISYNKGASVIRMLHDFIGDEAFRAGMHTYLTAFSYKNTFTEDLWHHLEKASGKPVTSVMSDWTSRMGFPCIKVTSHQDGNCRVLTLEQSKFSADGAKSASDSPWKVPVSILRRDGKVERFLLEERTATHRLEGVGASDWLKLNAGTVGFYRVQYSTEMLDQLMEGIRLGEMSARDRFNVENDVFALAKAGIGSTVDTLRVMLAFADEVDTTVWNDIAVNWGEVRSLLLESDYCDHVKKFGRKLFEPLLPRVGWDAQAGESHLKSLLRSLVVRMLGRHEHEEVVAECKCRFEKHLNQDHIAADLRAPIYSTVLSVGDEKTLEAMLELHKAADLQEEKTRIERALGAVKDEVLIRRVLEFSLGGTVRNQDIVFLIGGVSGTLAGRRLTWEFVKEKWDDLVTMYESGSLLCRLIKLSTEGFVTEERAREVEEFFAAHPLPSTERTIQQSCENIRLRAAWLAREGDELKKFFTEHA